MDLTCAMTLPMNQGGLKVEKLALADVAEHLCLATYSLDNPMEWKFTTI